MQSGVDSTADAGAAAIGEMVDGTPDDSDDDDASAATSTSGSVAEDSSHFLANLGVPKASSGGSAASARPASQVAAKRAKAVAVQQRKANIREDYDHVFESLKTGADDKALDIGWKLCTCLLLPSGIVTRKRKHSQEDLQSPVSLFNNVHPLRNWPDISLKFQNRRPYVIVCFRPRISLMFRAHVVAESLFAVATSEGA
jgi:hypothetical protein